MEIHPEDLLNRAVGLAPVARLVGALGEGFEPSLWLVGGAVRDLLLGLDPVDVDVMVDGDFAPVATALGGVLHRHDAYLTATVDGFIGRIAGSAETLPSFDLARPRVERYERPGALPTVTPADSVQADLVRRDFSVNAVAIALTGPERGQLLAVDGALDDLSERVLRVLHPQSFRDDPTRLFRLARYAARLAPYRFTTSTDTLALARDAVSEGAVQSISGVRVGNELRRLAGENDAVRAFVALRELGVDTAVDPMFGLTDERLARRALTLLEPGDRAHRVVLAAALLGASAEQASELLGRLGFEADDRDVISAAAANAERVSQRLEFAGPPSAIDWAAGGPNGVAETVALAGAIHPANAAREWLVELRHRRLSIDGSDLLAAGVPAGPAVGQALLAARAALMDDFAPDRDSQLAAALEAVGLDSA